MRKLLLILLAGALAAGCTTTKAQTRIDKPALEVPAPPARVIEPAPAEPSAPEPVGELPTPPANNTPRSRPQRESNQRETKPVDPKATESTPPVTDPAPPPAPPAPAPQLRTPDEANPARAEKEIRDIIGRANSLLSKVDYRRLNGDRQKAYNEAKMFMQESEEALKNTNHIFARSLAEKAERLAKELQSR
jgi:hypothetical protein